MSIGLVACTIPQSRFCSSPAGNVRPAFRIPGKPEELPARFAGLTRMAAVVITPTSPSPAAKPLATSPWPVGFGFGLVDRQRPSPQFTSVQRSDRLIGFTGIGHFHKCETPRAARLPVSHDADLFDCAVCLECSAQLRLGCAVG